MESGEPDHSDISEFLFSLEDTEDLFEWTLDGVPVWEYVRVPIHRRILERTRSDTSTDSHLEDGTRAYLKGSYLWARNLVFDNPLFENTDVLGFGIGNRQKLEDGRWWDRFFDPIYDGLNLDYVHIEGSYGHGHRTPSKTDRLRYCDFIQYSGAIAYRLGLFHPTFSTRDERLCSWIESEISAEFDVSVDIESMVERRVTKAKVRKPLFKVLLGRVDPEIALLTCSYGRESFVSACKKRNVPVVELQHGGFGPHHPGYVFPGERSKNTFPDYVFVFGDLWKDNIEFPIPDENVFAVGYPYLEDQVRKYGSHETRDQIVVISQRPIGPSLSKFATELAADDQVSSDIVYKLHPKEYDIWEETYPWLKSADLTVIDSDTPPLYQILSESRALIGVYSTVIYEGFNFGLDTYLYDVSSVSQMEWILDMENVHLVSSVEEFVEAYRGERYAIETTRFFADDPLQRIRAAMETITGTSLDGSE